MLRADFLRGADCLSAAKKAVRLISAHDLVKNPHVYRAC